MRTWVLKRGMASLGKRTAALIAALVAAMALLALSASKASGASSYQVYECDNIYSKGAPDAQPGGDANRDEAGGGWNTFSIQYWAACDSNFVNPPLDSADKGVFLHPSYPANGPRHAGVLFQAPPTTYMGTGSFEWDIGAHWWNNAAYSAGVYQGSALAVGQVDFPRSGTHSWNGCGNWCPTSIWFDVNCQNSLCLHRTDDGSGNQNNWYFDYIAIRKLSITLVDVEPPSLALSGSLFDDPIAHGTPELRIDAADRGGGVETVAVEVNDVRVAAPVTECPGMPAGRGYATQFRPCNDFHGGVALDTEKTPWRDGENAVRVCVGDVNTGPGGGSTTCEQRTVSVDNSCPDSSGVSGQALSISAGLEDPQGGKLKRARSVRSNEGTALRGHLAGSGGAPVKAASLCVYEAVDEPAGIEQLVQVAKSSSRGDFGVELPAGPSRSFRVAYRYGAHQLESGGMYLDSSVLPTLELSKAKLRNGRAVSFSGRIPGPDNDGRAVTMQAKVGKKWRSFKQLQTDRNGNYRGKYRFTQTRGRVLYVFRALVKKQGGYPYSPGHSRKRKVLVRG